MEIPLILARAGGPEALLHLGRAVRDLGEAHHRDGVVLLDLAAVDLLEDVHQLLEPAELGVVVLEPTVISTTSPLRYLLLLSPRRMVAVLRPRLSWSTKMGE